MRFVVHVIGPLVGQRDGQPAVGSMAYVVDVVLATVTGARGSTMAGVSTSGPAISWPAELATARLTLRPIESGDVPAISRLWTDPEVRRYLGGPVAAAEVAARQRGCVGAAGWFSVLGRLDRTVLGLVLLEPDSRGDRRTEVSYSFLPEHWGHGYAREAVAAAVGGALADAIAAPPAVIAITQQANVRSRRLLESIGMDLVESLVEFDVPQVMYSVDRIGLQSAANPLGRP